MLLLLLILKSTKTFVYSQHAIVCTCCCCSCSSPMFTQIAAPCTAEWSTQQALEKRSEKVPVSDVKIRFRDQVRHDYYARAHRVNVHVVGQGLHHFGFGSGVGPLPRRRDVAAENKKNRLFLPCLLEKSTGGSVNKRRSCAGRARCLF